MEVQGEHVYRVMGNGLLVHNQCIPTPRKSSSTIRNEWQKANGKSWPKDPATGKNQDVSHIKALADGGTNGLENIVPLPHAVHVQQHIDAGGFIRWGAMGGGS